MGTQSCVWTRVHMGPTGVHMHTGVATAHTRRHRAKAHICVRSLAPVVESVWDRGPDWVAWGGAVPTGPPVPAPSPSLPFPPCRRAYQACEAEANGIILRPAALPGPGQLRHGAARWQPGAGLRVVPSPGRRHRRTAEDDSSSQPPAQPPPPPTLQSRLPTRPWPGAQQRFRRQSLCARPWAGRRHSHSGRRVWALD